MALLVLLIDMSHRQHCHTLQKPVSLFMFAAFTAISGSSKISSNCFQLGALGMPHSALEGSMILV